MLYDQPQLVQAYLAAFQATGEARHAAAARGILDYLLRDLRHPGGGFFSAEDADSPDPEAGGASKEGAFYLWRAAEFVAVLRAAGLSDAEAAAARRHFGVRGEGNASRSPRSDPHGEFRGRNVLYEARPLAETAAALGASEGAAAEKLARAREALFAARARRFRPQRDEKIVACWNGAAIGALAVASRALAAEDPPLERLFPVEGRAPREYLAAAEAAAAFVREKLYDEEANALRRSFLSSPSPVAAFAEDYAWLISGLLDLHAAGSARGAAHLRWALALQRRLDLDLWDAAGGGYFDAAAGDASVRVRLKEMVSVWLVGCVGGSCHSSKIAPLTTRLQSQYDGAEPAASSIACANLWRLAALGGADAAAELRARAEACAAAFAGRLEEAPLALPQLAAALRLLELGHSRQVVIAGRRGAPDTEALLDACFAVYAPDRAVILLDAADEESMAFWREHNPEAVAVLEAAAAAGELAGGAVAYMCAEFVCHAGTREPARARELLAAPRPPLGAKPRVARVPVPFSTEA
jgi:uncharacterized protein YyaL (SSP411 family)